LADYPRQYIRGRELVDEKETTQRISHCVAIAPMPHGTLRLSQLLRPDVVQCLSLQLRLHDPLRSRRTWPLMRIDCGGGGAINFFSDSLGRGQMINTWR
jgi:hypothetical protein